MRYLVVLLAILSIGWTSRGQCPEVVEMPYIHSSNREFIEKTFPLLDILDEWIDWTGNISFYKVKNKQTGEVFELFYRWWDENWVKRTPRNDDKAVYNFEIFRWLD